MLLDDRVIEIEQTKVPKKKKKQNKKKLENSPQDNNKVKRKRKVKFDLKQNKTKEFYMNAKVSLTDIPKSKE